jgi:septum formation protein
VKLLLVSGSATRRTMLTDAGVPFDTALPLFDEGTAKAALRTRGTNAADLALALAGLKAKQVTAAEEMLVIGCDQTLELEDGSMLDKPGSRDEAYEQLLRMSGGAHRLHSAAVVMEKGETVWANVETVTLAVRALSEDFIEDYLDAEYEMVRGSVGAFRIEGRGVQLFDRVEGSHFAILGLPLLPLLDYLRERGVIPS